MYRYTWVAIQRDGSTVERWNEDGTENRPDPYNTAEFHMMPIPDIAPHLRPVSLFLGKTQKLIYVKRRHMESSPSMTNLHEDPGSVVFVIGVEDERPNGEYFSMFWYLLPDGRMEISHDFNQPTIYDRNLHKDPPRFYERV